ncbi:hypothetical protein BUALT_Bualt18G0120600 [Buddleja alternifolia]|uniref:Fe2OG dioxygenase domain-containing protein n=1 Tax=Buddleja alternifolia TaxID=168488 RepID=A0AAV6WD02_9LAMI|nr:hypothetical protein BUALT_Bualt18G0120600 [Buddleja alternifolia]
MSEPEVVNFGKSLIVPSVKELVKEPVFNIPTRYVRTDHDPPMLCEDVNHIPSIPVIDLQRLLSIGKSENHELEKLHLACQEWGFFQIKNHGVSDSLVEKFRSEVVKFFELPMEEKRKLWQHPDNHEGFGQLFVVSEEQKLDWSDMFYITTLPTNLRQIHLFQKLPTNLRETIEDYSEEMKKLAMTLLSQLAQALKMDDEEMRQLYDNGVQSIRMNYYPPCPMPERAIGFTPHSDADALTILFQLNETEGLQIRRDGKWVPVKPLPNAFIVNVGDALEIVSNGMYRSIEHRAIVNSSKERISVATFYSSNMDSDLGPARSLIGPNNPPIFRRMPIHDYFKEFFARKLNGKSYLDFMKLEEPEVVNFGKSLIVPSVQELAKEPIFNIPTRYVRTDQDPPMLCEDVNHIPSIPVIDLQRLLSIGKSENHELEKLHLACKEWGFFQIINHGVSHSLVEKFRSEVVKFFELPMEEKRKLWQHPDNHEGFGQLFVVSEEQKL